ncbi:MAG: metallophosphoesterase [Acetatifactor sp.]
MMEKVFFIADPHFGGESIIRYENRPFASAEEMDKVLVERWNAVVSKQDTVYVLGDFSMFMDDNKDYELLQVLNGRKILIMGNHDRHRTSGQWRQLGFEECSLWPIVYRDFYILSHEPVYINKNMPYVNVYGHVHSNPSYRDASPQSVCVSAERTEYQPVTFEDIKKMLRG